MSSEHVEFTKDNIDLYLKEVAKEYRKQVGKGMPAELILIGGASVLVNYGFRNMTTDVDALIHAASGMKDAINRVGDRFGLPNGWLNADFKNTASYTPKLDEVSVYYKTYSNVLTVRTVAAEYLIAMKLRSGRQYKSDLSDVLGILAEHGKRGTPITMEQIQKAVTDLYGGWTSLSDMSQAFISNVMEDGRFEQLYAQIVQGEQETKKLLIRFEKEYPSIAKEDNVDAIAVTLQKKRIRLPYLSFCGKGRQKSRKPSRERRLGRGTIRKDNRIPKLTPHQAGNDTAQVSLPAFFDVRIRTENTTIPFISEVDTKDGKSDTGVQLFSYQRRIWP